MLLNRLGRTMTFSITGSPLIKAIGWKREITVTASGRVFLRIGGLTRTGTGFGLIVAGTGIQTSVLPGPLTTTGDGPTLTGPDGAGFPAMNGLRPGSPGDKATKTLAGHLFRPKQIFRQTDLSHPGPTRIMTLDRLPMRLSAILIGTNRATPAISSHPSGTFRSIVRPGTSPTLSPTTT